MAPATHLILAGEVKLPGTPEGRNAHNSALVDDSNQKAANAGSRVLLYLERQQFRSVRLQAMAQAPLERRVKDYDLGLDLDSPPGR